MPTTPRPSGIKPMVLLILDGYGLAPPSEGNAITLAKKPFINSYYKLYPHGQLIASGESVGLPANEEGNTEVGHLTIGAGRVIDQDLVRINKAIKDGNFFDNKAFLDAVEHVRKNNSKLHIAGLIGSGNVHSSMEHFWALVEFCKQNKLRNIYFHLFTDGRDSPPQEGMTLIQKIDLEIKNSKVGAIASIAGRYFAMDRDGRWDRTKRVYDALVLGRGHPAYAAVDAIRKSYTEGKTDEFIEPTVIVNQKGIPIGKVDDGDAFIFFNFRIDRPRQLAMAFVLPNFESLRQFEFGEDPEKEGKSAGVVKFEAGTFRRERTIKDLFFVTMTEYQKNLPVSAVAYPKIVVKEPLAEVLSKSNLMQMHLSESEKERFVTYYFNGQRQEKFRGEESLIIPSPKVATYDKAPQMSVFEVVNEFKRKSNEGRFHFFVINFANPDMVAHSGNLPASIKAIEFTDQAVGLVVNWTLALGGTVVLTADHGNAEELLTYPTTAFFITTEEGQVNTDHSNNPVPVFVISEKFKGKPLALPNGALADVAPTALSLMGIPKPVEMTGKSLI